MELAKDDRSALLRRIAASSAPAVMWTAVGCPFDVIKTRCQTARVPFASPAHCLMWTVRREGPGALWKGFLPQLLLSSPYSAIMFGVYDSLKPLPTRGDRSSSSSSNGESYIAGCFLAGAASGVAVTAVHNPLELWRVRVQTHLSSGGSTATNSSVLRSLRKQPWQAHFRGGSMTLLENVVGNGVFFASNEAMRRQLLGGGGEGPGSGADLGWGQEALVGGLTGVVFQLVIYPFDLVKARLMTREGLQARQAARQIWRDGGVRGMYRGASVMVLRASIINAAGWPALRWAQRALGSAGE